jgi:hypothetical protein
MTDADAAAAETTVQAGAWRCAAVSVRGASHHRTGMPNQDAAAAILDAAGLLILAVADGHGSAPHSRSDEGSHIAVEVATAAVRDAARAWHEGTDGDAIARALQALPERIIADWRSKVADALAATPLSMEESDRLAMLQFDDSAAYGATLVLAVLHPRGGALIQVGDGDIHLVDTTGRISKPLPDEDAPGEATSSLCLPQAEAAVRMHLLRAADVAEIAAVVASTDGLVKSHNDKRVLRGSLTSLAARLASGAEAAFVTEVSSWLPQVSSAGNGDDISVAVAARASADAAWVTPDEPPAVTTSRQRDDAQPHDVTTDVVPADANSSARWIAAAALLLLLLLAAAGYVWREPIAATIARWTAS